MNQIKLSIFILPYFNGERFSPVLCHSTHWSLESLVHWIMSLEAIIRNIEKKYMFKTVTSVVFP